MSKMDKATVIYGADNAKVSVDKVNWTRVTEAIEAQVGAEAPIINLAAAKTSVVEAKKGKNAAKTYVKIGLVGNDFVFRVKTPGILTDTEVDTILVKGAKALMAKKKEETAERVVKTKEEYESSKTRDVKELAEEHLELRKQMVQETKKLLEDVEGALASATDWGTKAEGYLERIKGEKGLGERQQLTGVIEQMRERNKAQVDRLQVFYKKFTQSGGPLMNSRVDFRGLSQLPTGEQADYKKNSGAYFRQASATMEEVSTKMSALASADGKLEELMEQAQALIGGGMSPTEALVRLEDIRMDSEAVVEGIARRFTKLEQTLDRTNQVWTTVISGSEELKAQRLKSLTMKIAEVDKLVEAIKQQKEPLDRINRRITSIPEDVKGDKAVAKAIDDILKEVTGARLKLRQMPTLLTNWKNLRTEAETALGVGA